MTVFNRPQPTPDSTGSGPEGQALALLPDAKPFGVLDEPDGTAALAPDLLLVLYRQLVWGRRYNQQATALALQGRLAVYPSSTGQEAAIVGAVLALDDRDWLFPTYRDTLSLLVRGVDPVEALTLLRGDWHSGYDCAKHRIAPLSTPLATQMPHAVGLAHAARLRGDPVVALALVGDGGTSEGDFHEALNFAAVYRSPVVFLIQNNGYAISVPLRKQTAAPSLAHKAIGYGMPGVLVDGNDAAAMYLTVRQAADRARDGGGPTLIEALTYRIDPHTNADDASRYRDAREVEEWQRRDPVTRMERYLRQQGLLDDDDVLVVQGDADALAANLRDRLAQPGGTEPTRPLRARVRPPHPPVAGAAGTAGGGDGRRGRRPAGPARLRWILR